MTPVKKTPAKMKMMVRMSSPPVADADGSEANPYQIGTAEELAAFRDKVNGSGGTAQNDAMPC